MKSLTFINLAKEIEKRSTRYAYGFTGQQITAALIDSKAKQYPNWYSKQRIESLKASSGSYGYDCSGLIKAIFREVGESFPDINADGIFTSLCKEESGPPQPGYLIHNSGHIGICLDADYVIEASSGQGKVVISKRLDKSWEKYGKCSLIEYVPITSEADIISDLKALIKKYGG